MPVLGDKSFSYFSGRELFQDPFVLLLLSGQRPETDFLAGRLDCSDCLGLFCIFVSCLFSKGIQTLYSTTCRAVEPPKQWRMRQPSDPGGDRPLQLHTLYRRRRSSAVKGGVAERERVLYRCSRNYYRIHAFPA